MVDKEKRVLIIDSNIPERTVMATYLKKMKISMLKPEEGLKML